MNRPAKISAFSLTRSKQKGAARLASILALCATLAFCAGLGFLAIRGCAGSPRSDRDASLLLLGFTNRPAPSSALFCLTNNSRAHIACVPEAFEQLNAGTWARTPLTGKASRAVRNWIGVEEELRPHQGFAFFVPPPTNRGPWRLIFMCQEQTQLVDPVVNTVRQVSDTNAIKTHLRQFSGRRYYVTSPAVTP